MNEPEIYDLIERELRPIERQLDEDGRVELDAILTSLAGKIHRSLRGESGNELANGGRGKAAEGRSFR